MKTATRSRRYSKTPDTPTAKNGSDTDHIIREKFQDMRNPRLRGQFLYEGAKIAMAGVTAAEEDMLWDDDKPKQDPMAAAFEAYDDNVKTALNGVAAQVRVMSDFGSSSSAPSERVVLL